MKSVEGPVGQVESVDVPEEQAKSVDDPVEQVTSGGGSRRSRVVFSEALSL